MPVRLLVNVSIVSSHPNRFSAYFVLVFYQRVSSILMRLNMLVVNYVASHGSCTVFSVYTSIQTTNCFTKVYCRGEKSEEPQVALS